MEGGVREVLLETEALSRDERRRGRGEAAAVKRKGHICPVNVGVVLAQPVKT